MNTLINSVWVREGNEATLHDWPIGLPVLLVSGSTATAREHRKTVKTERAGSGGDRVLYTLWEVWGEVQA